MKKRNMKNSKSNIVLILSISFLCFILSIGYASLSVILDVDTKIVIAVNNNDIDFFISYVDIDTNPYVRMENETTLVNDGLTLASDGQSFTFNTSLIKTGSEINYRIVNRSSSYKITPKIVCSETNGYTFADLNNSDVASYTILDNKIGFTIENEGNLDVTCMLTYEAEGNTEKVPSKDLELWPVKTLARIKVEFDPDGGSVIDLNGDRFTKMYRYVKTGEKIGKLPSASKSGKGFIGWYMDENIISENTIIDENSSAYIIAHWSSDCTYNNKSWEHDGRLYNIIGNLTLGTDECNDIDYSNISSDTNGKGIYTIYSTNDDEYPIYFYRGNVTNNNVLFGNFCWKAVRTTNTGGVKLIFNGEPNEEGHCTNSTTASTQIGTTYFNKSEYALQNASIGYMYGKLSTFSDNGFSTSQSTKTFSATDITTKYIATSSTYTFDQTRGYYKITKSSCVYSDCYESLPGKYINSTSLLSSASSSTESSSFLYKIVSATADGKITYVANKSVGFDGSYDEAHANTNESLIKKEVENWYKTKLSGSSRENLIEDTVYCNDRSMVDLSTAQEYSSTYIQTGFAKGKTVYNSYKRLKKDYNPSLVCTNSNDRFSVSSSKGNGKLNYPVGLLTADEIVFAGGNTSTSNSSMYLYTGRSWFTMSPAEHTGSYSYMYYYNTSLSSGSISSSSYGIRPVISLSNEAVVADGIGTSDEPYKFDLEIRINTPEFGTFTVQDTQLELGESTLLTLTPYPAHYLESLTCTNGWTLGDFTTGIYADGVQNVVLYNNNQKRSTMCTAVFKKFPCDEQIKHFENNTKLYNLVSNQSYGTDECNLIDYTQASSDANGKGIYTIASTKDDEYPISIYRGAVTNNNLLANGLCWKIVRTTETGGTKLIYNGIPVGGKCINTGTNSLLPLSKFNENEDYDENEDSYYGFYDDNAYVGYMYKKNEVHGFEKSSIVKENIDDWYEKNMSNYTNQLEDTVFCNDRTIVEYNGTLGTGLGRKTTYYSAVNRLYVNKTPSLECSNVNDRFTVNNTLGNGALTYPVGLLTADEIVYAGLNFTTNNTSSYINSNYMWTMTPYSFSSFSTVIYSSSKLNTNYAYYTNYIRPSISLKNDTIISMGDGSSDNPYALSLNVGVNVSGNGYIFVRDKEMQPNEKTVLTVTPGVDQYLYSVSCSNGWGVGSYETGYEATGVQIVELTSVENKHTTCTATFKKIPCDYFNKYHSSDNRLYNIMANKTKGPDTCNGLSYYGGFSETGVYTVNKTRDYEYPVFFNRGSITNNNVLFNNKCWKIVRTTDTGGTKLVYNGEYTHYDYETIDFEDYNVINNNSKYPYVFNEETKQWESSVSKVDTNSVIEFTLSEGDYYIFFDYDTDFEISIYLDNALITKSAYLYGSMYTGYVSLLNIKSNNVVKFKYDYEYHYSDDNWLKFHLVKKGTTPINSCNTSDVNTIIGTSMFNESGDNADVGYMYGERNALSYAETHANKNNSIVKTNVDNWYKKEMSNVTNKLEDTIWCNDRSMPTEAATSIMHPQLGYGINYTLYNGYKRMDEDHSPTVTCINKNDSFTVNESDLGNGKLTYPVGLLTSDEVIYAGAHKSYLKNDLSWWTMTPYMARSKYYVMDSAVRDSGYVNDIDSMDDYFDNSESIGVRPAISLKYSTTVSGTGTVSDPYQIVENTYNVSINDVSNGTVSVRENTLNLDESTILTITPNSGYALDSISCTNDWKVGNYSKNSDEVQVVNLTASSSRDSVCTVSFIEK